MAPARVAAIRCASYDTDEVRNAVSRGLALLGGATPFVSPGETIVLKPNLLLGSPSPVTTHPAVFRAVAAELLEAGVHLQWGDSSGIGTTLGAGKRAGLAQVADELGVPVVEFARGREVSFPEGGLIKQFTIAEGVLAADGIVSLPKLKTHALTRMTGAIKNQFGCIPGLLKGEFHMRMPDASHFARMLVDLNRLLKPRLFVMDAVVSMEGNGPRNGDPRQTGLLLFSADPVALDAVACRVIDLEPALVETIVWGERFGLGSASEIELAGDELPVYPDFNVNRHHMPPSGVGMGTVIGRRLVSPRPVIDAKRCTRCGTCVQMCPVRPKALDFAAGDRSRPPEHDYDRCIRCYCCQELCPERAIEVKTPFLGRLIRR